MTGRRPAPVARAAILLLAATPAVAATTGTTLAGSVAAAAQPARVPGTTEADATDVARSRSDARRSPAASAGLLHALRTTGRPGARIPLAGPSRANGAVVAKVLRATTLRERPGAGRRLWLARTQTAHSRGATRLMVLAARRDRHGRPWLRVDAPIRPNRLVGWVAARDTQVSRTRWYLSVSTSRRELRVYRGGALRRRARLVVGAPFTPTPHGLFAVWEVTRQANPRAFVGPFALHLTALSNVLDDFGGGPGRVALHGRGPASLVDPLGSARSHGCLRADNAVIDWLRGRARPGTPIRIGP